MKQEIANLYLFTSKEEINLNDINGNAIILVGDNESLHEVLTIKNHQICNLPISPTIHDIIERALKDLNKQQLTPTHQLIIDEEWKSFSVAEIAKLLQFPYASTTFYISKDGTSLYIPTPKLGEPLPLLQDNAGKTLKKFEAINFLRQFDANLKNSPFILADNTSFFLGCMVTDDNSIDQNALPKRSIFDSISINTALLIMLQKADPTYPRFFHEITKITCRFRESSLTPLKKLIFEDFKNYCCLNAQENDSRANLVQNWAEAYKQKNNGQNPFDILKQQRREGIIGRFFKPKFTNSIKLFKQLIGNEELPSALQEALNDNSSRNGVNFNV